MILLFSPLIMEFFRATRTPKGLVFKIILPLSYYLYSFQSFYIILLSVILELILTNSKITRFIRLINRVFLSTVTLLILIKIDRFNFYFFIILSIQFLLALFVALKYFSRDCFYIIPISFIPLFHLVNLNLNIIYVLSTMGILLVSVTDLINKYKNIKEENRNIKRSNLITTNLITKIHEDISAGVENKTLLSSILYTLNKFVGSDSSGIKIMNLDQQIEFISTDDFVPIDLKGIEQKEYYFQNLEECREARFHKYTRNIDSYISSLIILPIKTESRLVGYLIIENRTFGEELTTEALIKSRLLLSIIETAIESLDKNRELLRKKEQDRDISIASEIQKNLIENKIKLKEGSVSVISKAAKGMNGDFFTLLPLKKDKTLIVICDVAGKGIPAAIVTVIINTTIQIMASQIDKASELVKEINSVLCNSVNIERYATLCAMIIDQKNKSISFSNAGHHPPIIKRGGTIFELKGAGLPTGITPKSNYEEVSLNYQTKDQIVLYTDGIVESVDENGNHFDSTGVKEEFKNQICDIPLHFISSIYQKSEDHSYKNFNFDDRTIIGVRL